MSVTKAVHVHVRLVWVRDNAHDVMLAHLDPVVEAADNIDHAMPRNWRI